MFYALHYQAAIKSWNRLEAGQYSQEETSIVKIPMALPYPGQEGVYERIQDDFKYNGEYYKGIKQKIENDTLFIVCVKDAGERHLDNVMTNYEKVTGDDSAKSKQGQSLLSKLLKEYETLHPLGTIRQNGWTMVLSYTQISSDLIAFERSVQSPPPKQLS